MFFIEFSIHATSVCQKRCILIHEDISVFIGMTSKVSHILFSAANVGHLSTEIGPAYTDISYCTESY